MNMSSRPELFWFLQAPYDANRTDARGFPATQHQHEGVRITVCICSPALLFSDCSFHNPHQRLRLQQSGPNIFHAARLKELT